MIKKFRGMNISSKDPKRLVLFYQEIIGLNILDNDSNYEGKSIEEIHIMATEFEKEKMKK